MQRLPWLPVSLLVAGVSIGLTALDGTVFIEQRSYNLLHQLRSQLHPPEWDSRITVIAIDEASLSEYGRFPWPRDRYAQLLDQLWVTQPATVTFDLLLPESSPQDGTFADAIAESGNVVLAVGNDGYGNTLTVAPTLTERAQGSFTLGYVNHQSDADGVSRRVTLEQSRFPSLGVATLSMAAEILAQTQTSQSLPFSAISLPDEAVWLNWPGPVPHAGDKNDSSLRVLSFTDVAEGRVNLDDLQNTVVLVGLTAVGVDPIRTPFHLALPTSGVYLHAAALDNLLNQRFLRQMPKAQVYLLLVLLSGLTGAYLHNRGAAAQLLWGLGFPILWLGGLYGAFLLQLWLPIAAPIGVVWLTVAALQLQAQRDKQQLMELFAMSVAPETAKVIWQRKQEILDRGELATQDLTATVLFMDIRNFTQIAQQLPSHVLMVWLNDYFSAMTDCIMAHGGVVDKYIGDAIMAVFGAPFPRTEPEQIRQDAISAVQASVQMHATLKQLNQRFTKAQLPTISFGIGIHTGSLTAGVVGNRYRMSYSLFGDTVNIAARIENTTKQLAQAVPYRLLLSAATQQHIKGDFSTGYWGAAALRGRSSETVLYTIEPTKR
ncbi:MAG: adenylate/guanylate cyclase domain-containing protein [Cyanobacteria bacterium P01_A01_bin.105]